MDTHILKTVGEIAGIGGLGMGVALLVFKDIIRRNIFPTLTRNDAYSLLRLIAVLSWSIAILGVIAWVYTSRLSASQSRATQLQIPTFNTIDSDDKSNESDVEDFVSANLGRVVHINTTLDITSDDIFKGFGKTDVSLTSTGATLVIRGSEYELAFYKGQYRFSGYFVIDENIEYHQGAVYGLKAIPPESVVLHQ